MIAALAELYRPLVRLNSLLHMIGRNVAWVLLAIMTAFILIQVVFRYAFNNALPWPEEGARALMIWMTALVAPTALRWGGFVSIDMIKDALPTLLRNILSLAILLLITAVLIQLFVLSFDFVDRGWRTRAASFQLPRAYIYMAMPVCFGGMLLVSLEMLMREIGHVFGMGDKFPPPSQPKNAANEAE